MNQNKKKMSNFLNTYHMENIVKQKTCLKNPDRPSCINLILTNSFRSSQDTCTVETGFSDFHKLFVTAFKLYFPKQKPNRSEPVYELSKLYVFNIESDHF